MPGSSQPKIEKALELAADELVLDLEDAVVPSAKDEARAAVVATMRSHPEQAGRIAVRVNPPGSPWCHLDLIALVENDVPPAWVVVPKVEGREEVAFAEYLIRGVGARLGVRPAIRLQALIESARGLEHAAEIATASDRLDAIILGYADLGASLGRRPEGRDSHGPSWDPARHTLLVAARAAGVRALDGPYLGLDAGDDFIAATRHARALGFDGKWAIHPAQIPHIEETFAPTEDEIQRARQIIHALDASERNGGAGAVALNGEMLDEAVRRWAVDILAEARAQKR